MLNTTLSPSSGDPSLLANLTLNNNDAPYDSESDLSEVANPAAEGTTPSALSQYDGAQDSAASESSGEGHDASDDADFNMDEAPVPAEMNSDRRGSSTSTESRPRKRKQPVEDEHILANPELYGLRRSVSRTCLSLPRPNL